MPNTRHPKAASVRSLVRGRADVVAVVAVGGALGSAARWLVNEALPHPVGRFPWSTLIENLSGSLLLGVLLAYVLEVWRPGRYLRAFLGTGVLGGYTTFSTYSADTLALTRAHHTWAAFGYLVGTLAGGLVAAWFGLTLVRALVIRTTTTEDVA